MINMSENKNGRKTQQIIGGIWLVVMVLLWVTYGLTGANTILLGVALGVTLAGPVLESIIKSKKKIGATIGGIWLIIIVLLWVYSSIFGGIIFYFALILTIAGPALFIIFGLYKNWGQEMTGHPLGFLGYLGFFGCLGFIDGLNSPLNILWLFAALFFLFFLGNISYTPKKPKVFHPLGYLGFLFLLTFLGFVNDILWTLGIFGILFLLGAIPKKVKK
jgi:hypothetical protein